jgi:hypothetical protein
MDQAPPFTARRAHGERGEAIIITFPEIAVTAENQWSTNLSIEDARDLRDRLSFLIEQAGAERKAKEHEIASPLYGKEIAVTRNLDGFTRIGTFQGIRNGTHLVVNTGKRNLDWYSLDEVTFEFRNVDGPMGGLEIEERIHALTDGWVN